jgi:uncharacterized protein
MSGDVDVPELGALLASWRRVAVIGASTTVGKPAHDITEYLVAAGYDVVPVNPRATHVLGMEAMPSLAHVPEPIDAVIVFRPPEESVAVANAAISAGAQTLWYQPGTSTPEAVAAARSSRLTVIAEACVRDAHIELIGPPAGREADPYACPVVPSSSRRSQAL